MLPRYPLYVPSKGRAHEPLTIRFLLKDGVPFRVVCEPEEAAAYEALVGAERLLVLPESNQGLIYARNWIKAHASADGYDRHWQLDDNISWILRWYRGKRIPCNAGPALRCVEDFADRYENVAIAGLNYEMFAVGKAPPFRLNHHVYSCTLTLNRIPHTWRLRYNDDTDMCLQVLADGWCTILVNAFLIHKLPTMVVKGGNTDDLYQGDGRLTMARQLERMWPGVVTTERRFGRPQHVVRAAWKRFDTPLKLKPGVELDQLAGAGPNEYGFALEAVKPIKTPGIQRLYEEHQERFT